MKVQSRNGFPMQPGSDIAGQPGNNRGQAKCGRDAPQWILQFDKLPHPDIISKPGYGRVESLHGEAG